MGTPKELPFDGWCLPKNVTIGVVIWVAYRIFSFVREVRPECVPNTNVYNLRKTVLLSTKLA